MRILRNVPRFDYREQNNRDVRQFYPVGPRPARPRAGQRRPAEDEPDGQPAPQRQNLDLVPVIKKKITKY